MARTLFDMDEKESKERRARWLSPFYELWQESLGGIPNVKKMAKDLKPLVDMHGDVKVLAHLRVYLERTDCQFVCTNRFATTFGAWSPKENKKKHDGPTDAEIGRKLKAMGRIRLGWGPWGIQKRFEEVGFEGLAPNEQVQLVQAWRNSVR